MADDLENVQYGGEENEDEPVTDETEQSRVDENNVGGYVDEKYTNERYNDGDDERYDDQRDDAGVLPETAITSSDVDPVEASDEQSETQPINAIADDGDETKPGSQINASRDSEDDRFSSVVDVHCVQ